MRSFKIMIAVLLLLPLVLSAAPLAPGKTVGDFNAESVLILHYNRSGGDYEGWNVWVWPENGAGAAVEFSGADEYGVYAIVPFQEPASRAGIIVRKGDWERKDIEEDRFVTVGKGKIAEVWLKEGDKRIYSSPGQVSYTPQNPGLLRPGKRIPDKALIKRAAPSSTRGTLVLMHYYRPDGNYGGWNVWGWGEGAEGNSFDFEGNDEFGKTARISFPNRVGRVGFLIRKGDWEKKDYDEDRYISIPANGVKEVWIISGEKKVYEDPADLDFSPKVKKAFLDREDRILTFLSQPLDPQKVDLTAVKVTGRSGSYPVQEIKPLGFGSAGSDEVEIVLSRSINPEDIAGGVRLELPGLRETFVYARDILEGDEYSAPDAELGPRYTPDETVFRTWSPVAESVELLLYRTPADKQPFKEVPLERGGNFVWEATVQGDLNGVYYLYRFRSYGEDRIVPDIYCYAATKDSARSMVVDLDRTDPPEWYRDNPPRISNPTDEIIYEIHVRDYTVADEAVPVNWRGKYLGLTVENPAVGNRPSTGISHLLDLGVTAVHLLPIQDYLAGMDEYNWGYWTALFNVPEAQYSTNPDDPAGTIEELKTMIKTLHSKGIRVIMDVVYNHTSSSFSSSPFDQAVPWYYFRSTPEGTLRNESGTGNAFADERPMARKYIVDSLKYWAKEYHIDGFRFDLLGMQHKETVKALQQELLKIRPDITLYGEPWTGGGPTHFPKGRQKGMRMAVFNDNIRNALRGDLDGTARGYVMGDLNRANDLRKGIVGAIDFGGSTSDFALNPAESVNYVSAHDNLTLWDKLEKTMPSASEKDRRSMQKLALGIVLTSQGIAFLHGGSDFCRTKGGNHNSYNAGDQVNKFDWDRKAQYRDVFDYVAGLTHIRRNHPAFRMSLASQVRKAVRFLYDDPNLVTFTIDGSVSGDDWSEILVMYNGSSYTAKGTLPGGEWYQVVDAESASLKPVRRVTDTVSLPRYSMAVFYRD